jgi:hypothetical protein
MEKTVEEKNKATVLEAFDTLFNKRDYAAAEKLWSPHYIQQAPTLLPVVKACSISSRASRRGSAGSPVSSWPKAIW